VAINNISFNVKKGTIHGFLGPNGAGKTTTMKILTELIVPSAGEFKVSGKIGFLPENPPLYNSMTVNDYLEFVLKIYSDEKLVDQVAKVKKQCGLQEVGERLIGNLSKGFKQRVGIAQALIHNPEIIILDEPTVGLDPVAIVEIRNLIESLKYEHTVLFSSHQLHEVELLCQEITLVDKGNVLISGSLNQIQDSLSTKKNFKIKLAHFNEEIKQKIMQACPIDSIELLEKEHELFHLSIFCLNRFEEPRDTLKLTNLLAQESIGLLDFKEEKLDLEEIFKRMTLNKGVSV
jgi:ABC-2 type transport system ATP-binding protein